MLPRLCASSDGWSVRFTLDWITDPELRRTTGQELNKGESRNSLARAAASVSNACSNGASFACSGACSSGVVSCGSNGSR